jgi:predicted MFS family arabinose efflux permease
MKKLIFNPAFILLFIENFFFFSSRNSLNMLPPYLTFLGASKGYTGFFMNVSSLMLVVFVLFFMGTVSRSGKKRLLLSSFSLQLISLIFMFVFPRNLVLLMALQFSAAFSYAFGYTINSSLAFDIIPPQKRISGIAIFGLSGVLAAPAGSFFGEKIYAFLHPEYLFLLSAVFCILSIICVFLIKEEKAGKEQHFSTFWQIIMRKDLTLLFVLSLLLGGAWSVLATFLPDFTKIRLGLANLSSYFIANSIIAVLSRTVFARTIDNTSRKSLIISALSLILMSMGLACLLNMHWQLYAIGLLYGLGHSILYPVLNAAFVDSGKGLDKFSLSNAFIAMYTLGNVALCTILGIQGDWLGRSSGENGGLTSIFASMGILAGLSIPAALIFIKERELKKI